MNICSKKYLDQQMLINVSIENWYTEEKEHVNNITEIKKEKPNIFKNYFCKKNSMIVVLQATKYTLAWVSRQGERLTH